MVFRKSVLVLATAICGSASVLAAALLATSALAQSGGANLGSAQLYAAVTAIGVLDPIQSKGTLPCDEGGGTCNIATADGAFEVRFARDITACVYSATLGGPGLNDSPAGMISVSHRNGVPNAVFVLTRASTGAAQDKGFQLMVLC